MFPQRTEASRLMDYIETQVCMTVPSFVLPGVAAAAAAREEIVA